jgi:hypothetical protein
MGDVQAVPNPGATILDGTQQGNDPGPDAMR